jgi:1,4-dihydroxy-2-naphthoate octaprenyltransferase
MDVETSERHQSKKSAWLNALRLRTLPLALASTLTGAFLAIPYGELNAFILALTALTTILLQVNSNLANDYGDFTHGTDNAERIGPERALQSGAISPAQMKRAIQLTSILSLLSGLALLYSSPMSVAMKLILLAFGLAAIYASVRYTAGHNPYGYRGLGDAAVMAFFGILGVAGSFLCQTGSFHQDLLLPAITIGAFSTGVLNINNTRDIESDRNAGKITLAVKMGAKMARRYHIMLLGFGMVTFAAYAGLHFAWGWDWLFIATYPLFIVNAVLVHKRKAEALDPLLKQLALTTFLFAVFLGVGLAL